MTSDLKLLRVRFTAPIEVKGAGMTDLLELEPDPETGLSANPGVLATWIALARAVRITTARGETWVPEGNIRSLQPHYEPRPNTTPIAKRTVK